MVQAYIWASVGLVSLIALIGVVSLSLNQSFLRRIVVFLVAFSAGALFGNTFIHLLPEMAHHGGFTHTTGLFVLGGILISFAVENLIHWHHHHHVTADEDCEECIEPFSYMILFGDGVHNFIDGTVIAASYLVSVPAGIATTIAVALHEVPQEIGDFGVLVHGGLSAKRALLYNFASAATAFIGAGLVIVAQGSIEGVEHVLLPFAAGGFIYIAGSDLLPEINSHPETRTALLNIGMFVLGITLMYALTLTGLGH